MVRTAGLHRDQRVCVCLLFRGYPARFNEARLSWRLTFCRLMIWHNSARARQLLSTWWHVDMGLYALEHDYEQRAMHWVVAHLHVRRHEQVPKQCLSMSQACE